MKKNTQIAQMFSDRKKETRKLPFLYNVYKSGSVQPIIAFQPAQEVSRLLKKEFKISTIKDYVDFGLSVKLINNYQI